MVHHDSWVCPSPHCIISRDTPISVRHFPLVLWLLFHSFFLPTLHLWSNYIIPRHILIVVGYIWIPVWYSHGWEVSNKLDTNTNGISTTGSLKEKGRPHTRLVAAWVAASLFCLLLSIQDNLCRNNQNILNQTRHTLQNQARSYAWTIQYWSFEDSMARSLSTGFD